MPLPKPLLLLLISVVTITIAASLYISGSPIRARNQKRDTQRASDLQQLTYGIDNFWSTNQRLPASLDEATMRANQPTSSYYFPQVRDPQTGLPYEYRPLDQINSATPSSTQKRLYELCATFEESNGTGPWLGTGDMFWRHPVGRTCFTLEAK